MLELSATVAWSGEGGAGEGSTEAKGTGPLPYLYFEYRRLFSEDWRFIAGLGWLQVKIEDIDGGQWVGKLAIEYLLGDHWGFGAAGNLATVDVDWKGLETQSGESLYTGAIDMDQRRQRLCPVAVLSLARSRKSEGVRANWASCGAAGMPAAPHGL